MHPEDRASLERGLDAVLARLRGLVADAEAGDSTNDAGVSHDDRRSAHPDRRDRVAAVAGGPDGAADLREHRPRDLPSSGAAGRRLGVRLPPAGADDPARLHRAVGDRDPDHRPHRAPLAGRADRPSRPRHLGRHLDGRSALRVPDASAHRRARGHPRPAGPRDRHPARVGRHRLGRQKARRRRAEVTAHHRNRERTDAVTPDAERDQCRGLPGATDRRCDCPGHAPKGGAQVVEAVRLWTDDLDGFMAAVREHMP